MLKAATKIRDIVGWRGTVALYRLSEPVAYDGGTTGHVVVSAAITPDKGRETFLFPADDAGRVLAWGELDGSFRGGLSHKAALNGAKFSC